MGINGPSAAGSAVGNGARDGARSHGPRAQPVHDDLHAGHVAPQSPRHCSARPRHWRNVGVRHDGHLVVPRGGAAVRLLPEQPGRAGRTGLHALPHLLAALLALCHPLPDRHHRRGPHHAQRTQGHDLRERGGRVRAAAGQDAAGHVRSGLTLHVHEHGRKPQVCFQEALRAAAAAAEGSRRRRVSRGRQGRALDIGGGQEGDRRGAQGHGRRGGEQQVPRRQELALRLQ